MTMKNRSDFVEILCRSVHERYDSLRRMGDLNAASSTEHAWWLGEEKLECWWMRRRPVQTSDTDPRKVSLREATEALMYVGILASVDFERCREVVKDIWSPDAMTTTVGSCASSIVTRIIGYDYTIYTSDCLAPISERVFGFQPPSDSFPDNCRWFKKELAEFHLDFTPRPVPVRLEILMVGQDPLELTLVLRQIVQNVLAQRLYARSMPADEREQAAVFMRFEIVEVRLNERAGPPANADALECLARLVELGVTLICLPPICDEDTSAETSLLVVKSLYKLLPPRAAPDLSSPRPLGYVTVNEESAHLTQAVLSALQVNRIIPRVEVTDNREPVDWEDEDRNGEVIELWRWVAYALFSRHAEHNLRNITLHVDQFGELALEAMQEILDADNPLASLYETTFDDDRWLTASLFLTEHPGAPRDWVDAPNFSTPTPLPVRVIDRLELEFDSWWRVLLPGCGEAWVYQANATEIGSDDVRLANAGKRPVHIKVEGLVSSNVSNVLSLLNLISQSVGSLEVEQVETVVDGFDMTQWTADLLRSCPHLEVLELPWYAEIRRLRDLVEAAEAGHFHLRHLILDHAYDAESSDIIDFLGVLSDMTHPLTRRLEEIHLSVSDGGAGRNAFGIAWKHMLQHNRKLRSILLSLWADETVEKGDPDVAIRTGPLHISSKLAFLSVVQSPDSDVRDSSARDRLDTGVLATIFAFAAQHTVRFVKIDLDEH